MRYLRAQPVPGSPAGRTQYPDTPIPFNLVEIGRADAAVTGRPAAMQYVKARGGMRVVEKALTTEEYGMAVRKDTPELTRAVNAALAKLKADGTYAQLIQKWFGAAHK